MCIKILTQNGFMIFAYSKNDLVTVYESLAFKLDMILQSMGVNMLNDLMHE